MNPAELLSALQAKFPEIQEIPRVAGQARGEELYVTLPRARLAALARFIRFAPPLSFDFLSFVTSVDWKTHFELVYYFVSTLHRHKLVFKVKLEDRVHPELESLTPIWPTADWQEREVFDLMGIGFTGHYNLRRILLPDDWEGYPLRKDYAPKPDRYD